MRADDRSGPAVLLAQEQRDGLGGKSGKSRQATAEAGRDEQADFRRQALELVEHAERCADDEAAEQVCRERAERQRRQERIERDAETPAQQCASESAESDSEE